MRWGFFVFLLVLALPVLAAAELKITTDKPVYEAGESVRVSGSLLDNSTPVFSSINASLLSGSTVLSSNLTSTANGTYSTHLSAPSSTGNYKISVSASGASGYIGLKVAHSANFKIDVSRAAYSPGDNVSVTVYVRDSLGSAVPNVSVNATLINSTGGLQNTFALQYSDSEGKAAFNFLAPSATGYYTFLVNGLFGQSIKVASFQIHAYITNSNGEQAWSFSPGDNVTINTVVTDSSGNPYTASVSAVVTSPPPTVTTAVTNFTNTSAGKYRDVYSAGAQEGSYSVKVTATSGTASAETYTNFQVSNLYVIVERIEGAEGSLTPNASYSALVTVRDATGSLTSNATVSASFSNSVGETVSTFSGSEDATSHIYKLSLRAPTDVGSFDFTITATADGKTATWANRVQVSSIKAILGTDKFTYSTGDTVSVTVETKPAITVTNLSYEVWGPEGIVSSGSNFSQTVNGTATFSFTAPRANGFYSLNAKVNGIVGVHSGFEVKKYMLWIDTRNGSSSDSAWQQIFPTGALVYLHVNFQDPSGQYINITSSVGNFSYTLSKLYSHTENKEYSGAVNQSSVYEGASSTVAVLYINTSSLIAGDYGVELLIKDKNGNSDTAYGGFRLGGFNIIAYPNAWQYGSGDSVNISVEVRNFDGSAISGANVTLVASEQAEKWPFVADALSENSVRNGTTDINGRTSLLLRSTWVFGFHNVRIQAVNGAARQEAFAGFVVRGFSLTGTIDKGESLYPGQSYTLTASAQDSTGTAMSSVNVTLIEVRSEKNWNLIDTPNDNLGLTDSGGSKSKTRSVPSSRQQGGYVLILKGEKNGEVVYANVRYEIKSFDVKFQSGKSGQYEEWFWAGLKQPGNTVDIPTKVTRGGTAVNNATISVVKLVRMDVWPNTESSTTSNSTSTSTGGTATVNYLIPSTLASGEYALILNVSYNSSSALTDPWRSPRVLVRTYEVFMDLQKDNRFIWSTMADENVSVVFNVRYPQNYTGVNNLNVSLMEIRNNDETLFRNLSVQAGTNYIYPNNRTNSEGIATIPLTTPNLTGTFIIVGRAGTEEFRRWFDVTSFTATVDMGNIYEFSLNGNVSFVAHAKDGSGRDISGVTVNVSGVWNNWDWTEVSTFVPQVLPTGASGASFRFEPLANGLTTPGDYSARVTFTSGSAVTEFWIWFRLKNFDVRVYPTAPFTYGTPINFTVETVPSTQNIIAKIIRLRSAQNWEIIRDYTGAEYASNFSGNTSATGITTVLGPALERGEYVAEFNITNAPPFFAWFEIRSFTIDTWLDRWAYQTGENVYVRVCANPLTTNLTVNYTAYGPSTPATGSFQIIKDVNHTTICNNGMAVPGITSTGGAYKLKLVIFNPTNPSQSEERWLWYEARTYDAWVWFDRWQMSPGETAAAHANVRLGRNALQNISVSLESIGFERDYDENVSQTNLGLTMELKGGGWEPQPYVVLNISGVSSLVSLNASPGEAPYLTGNYSVQAMWVFDKSGRKGAKIRVDKNITNGAGGKYSNATDFYGEAPISFPLPAGNVISAGSYSARFTFDGAQEVTPWFEVIPFSYRAYLSQGGVSGKFLNGGAPANVIVNSSTELNVSLVGLMRNGWEPVSGIVPSNDSRLPIGGVLSLGANSVRLVNITCPQGQWNPEMMTEPCRANITVNASGTVESIDAWPFWIVNYPGMLVNVREIRGDSAEISLITPLRNVSNSTQLANFSFTVPNEQGGYSVNLLLESGGITAYDMLWFSIDNVNAWGWMEKWQYNTGDNITLIAQVQRGPQPAQGYIANVTSLNYREDFSPTMGPCSNCNLTGANATTGSDGIARIRIPPQRGGEYEAKVSVFQPNSGVTVNFTQWFRVRSFDVWVYTPGDPAAYLGDNMTFVVETNPMQVGASVKLFEYAFDLVPEASVEIRKVDSWEHDFTNVQNGSYAELLGINVTVLGTTKACAIGPKMDFSFETQSATLNVSNGTFVANVTLSGRNPMLQNQDPTPYNVSKDGFNYELRLNDVYCKPINERFYNLANGTITGDGRALVTFNTTRLNDTVSTEHPISVNVTTIAGDTARGMGGFMLKPFDVEAWFEGKDSSQPSVLAGETLVVKVRVKKQTAPIPNVTIYQEEVGYCPENTGSTSGGGGAGPMEVPGPGPNGGGFFCPYNRTHTWKGTTDSNGMLSFNYDGPDLAGSYTIGILGLDPFEKKGFAELKFNLVSFSVSLDKEQTDAGSPITVSISSNLPNVPSVAQVEDHMQWNSSSNSFNFRTVAAGQLNSTGGGTLVINTTGLSGFYNMRVVLNGTKTASSSFEVNEYTLAVTTDKSTYLPGENIQVTVRATRGSFPLDGVSVTRLEWVDELSPWNMGSMGVSQTTGPDGTIVLSMAAPNSPSEWALKVESSRGYGPPVKGWTGFTVSGFILSANATSAIIFNNTPVTFTVSVGNNSPIDSSMNISVAFSQTINTVSKTVRLGNFSNPVCRNTTVAAKTISFTCNNFSLPGAYDGRVVLSRNPVSDFNNVQNALAVAQMPGVWVKNPGINVAYPANASGSTPPVFNSMNVTINASPNLWVPFVIESSKPFPESFNDVLAGLSFAKPVHAFNLTNGIIQTQVPDFGGTMYYLTFFTDIDLTSLSELVGGASVTGDLRHLVEIRESNVTIIQAPPTVKVLINPINGSHVRGNFTVQAMRSGNLTGVLGMRASIVPDPKSGGASFPFEGIQVWSLDPGSYNFTVWLTNDSIGTPLSQPSAQHKISFTVDP